MGIRKELGQLMIRSAILKEVSGKTTRGTGKNMVRDAMKQFDPSWILNRGN